MDDRHNQRRTARNPGPGLTYEFVPMTQTIADFGLAPGEPWLRATITDHSTSPLSTQISEFATEDEMAELRRRANVFLDRDFALFDEIGEFVNDHDFSRIKAVARRVGLTELYARMAERSRANLLAAWPRDLPPPRSSRA